MSFLGCLILGLPLPSLFWMPVIVSFADDHCRSVVPVDRLAFPHVGLGQVQSGLATKLCVLLYLFSFRRVGFHRCSASIGWWPHQM